MRGDQLSRQWNILRQIEVSKNGLTASEIAELCGVSLRTAYRDLDDLQFAGFPLYTEKGEKVNRWKFVDSYMLKVPQPFSFIIRKTQQLYPAPSNVSLSGPDRGYFSCGNNAV